MPAVRRKPAMSVGQVWTGRTKVGQPITRRRITEITDTHVSWELVGSMFKGPSAGATTISSWRTWAISLVQR